MSPYDQDYKDFELGLDWESNPFDRWQQPSEYDKQPSEYDDWRQGWNLADAWYNGDRDE